MFKNIKNKTVEYILIISTATILSIVSNSKSFSEENVFIVDNVKVEGSVDANFSREKYINKALIESFDMLISKILITRDLNKISNIKLKEVKNLINSIQVLDETFTKGKYAAEIKIYNNDEKGKRILVNKNISFTQPKKNSAVFYPALFVNDEIRDFDQNYFYINWKLIENENELINFVLPLEDLDDLLKIKEMKDKIEMLDVQNLVNKYDVSNYVFALMNHDNNKLKIHIQTKFEDSKISKNISYKLISMEDDKKLNFILKDLKLQITDLWKGVNIVNLLMPLSIKIKYQHKNLNDLDKLKNIFYKISIIDNYNLEELDVKNSFFKIYYYGNPKRLRTELSKFGYELISNKGQWELHSNE